MTTQLMTGNKPLYDWDRGFRLWLIDEIYPVGRMVPNIGDAILDWNVGFHRVIDVDKITYKSEWTYWQFTEQNDMDLVDILLGVGPGYTSETFRAYIDVSTKPFRMSIDTRLHSYGTMSSHYKVFLGTNISDSGTVISEWYDADGTYVGENIPFELAARSDVDNLSIKAPMAGYCNLPIKDGELVTLVAYSNTGLVVGINKLLAMNSAFIRKSEANKVSITHISLDSPYLADDVPNTLHIPMDTPIEALSLRGKIHYSNGLVRDVPIDGSKMRLSGFENYIATINGQTAPLVLTYYLSPSETTQVAESGKQYHISVPYRAVTTEVEGFNSVKLFPIPEWIDEFTGWRLQWYLYNLDRGDIYPVTHVVEAGVNATPFDGLLFGTKQYISVAVDMQKVDPRLAAFRHVQLMGITLMDNGLADTTPYYLEFEPGQNPNFGGNYAARVTYEAVGRYTVTLNNNFESLQAWLDALYYPVLPLYDSASEAGPLMPTHFILNLNGYRTKYPIADWNKAMNYPTGGLPGRGAALEWIRETGSSTLQLALTPLKIFHDVPSSGGGTPTLNLYPSWVTAIGQTDTMFFGSSSAVLTLDADGTGTALWTAVYDDESGSEIAPPITFVFADGVAMDTAQFEVKVEIDNRYENGSNYLYPDCILNQFMPIDGSFLVPVKMKGWVSDGAHITLRLTIRDKNDPENFATGLYTVRNGNVPG